MDTTSRDGDAVVRVRPQRGWADAQMGTLCLYIEASFTATGTMSRTCDGAGNLNSIDILKPERDGR